MTYRMTVAAALLLAGCMETMEAGPSPVLVGPVWIVQEVSGGAVPDEPAITLQLGADNRASGNGGCNQYGGSYELTGASLSFGEVAATRMACDAGPMEREQALLDALPKVTHFETRNDSELVLLAEDGRRVILLRRSDAPQP
jgi:putative lipoprotein